MSENIIENKTSKPEPSFILRVEGKQLWVTLHGQERKATHCHVIANGTHDLCFALNEKGKLAIKEIAKIPEEKILQTLEHDLLRLIFDPPINGENTLIIGITREVKEVVDDLVKRFGIENVCSDYEKYDGDEYGRTIY